MRLLIRFLVLIIKSQYNKISNINFPSLALDSQKNTINTSLFDELWNMDYTIKNIHGLEVIFAPMQDSTSITVEILVKAGSVYENEKTNGLSHFLEHMFFKWGKIYKSTKEVVETMDALGGEYNAFTGNDYAGYYVKSAPEHIYTALSVLGDMMVYPSFPKEEMEKEKGVVVQEIKMYEDRPDAKVAEIWDRNYFGDNSYGWSILGPEANVLSFTQDDLFQHKNNLYTKDNMVITIAGKIDDMQAIEDHIAKLFSDLPTTTTYEKPSYNPTHPQSTWDIVSQWTSQNHLVYGGEWFAHDNSQMYAAKLLANIVWGTMSSRLFQEVREKRWLCYYIGCSHHTQPTHGTFVIRAGLSKENYDEGIAAIKEVLATVAQGNITQEELDKAQGNMLGKIQMGIETSDQMSDFIWSQQLLYRHINTLEDILEEYKKVTLADIHAVAQYLDPEKLYGCTID